MLRYFIFFPAVILLWIAVAPAEAASQADNAAAAMPEGSASQAPGRGIYLLAVNDQLAITVRDHPDLSLSQGIRSDGKITLPVVGDIAAVGRTVHQVQEEITRRLSAYLRQPDVTVLIVSYHRESVFIVGEVRSFGTFPFVRGISAEEALNLAGGIAQDGDTEHVKVERSHKTVAILDLSNSFGKRFPLEPDDMVFVPKLPERAITLVGAVAHPGAAPLLSHERLLDALSAASGVSATGGGPTQDPWREADLSHLTLTRGSQVRTIDGRAVLQGSQDQNLALEAGDVIYVPPAAHIMVVGDVQRPGTQTLGPGERALDAVTAAGVPTESHTEGVVGAVSAGTPDLAHVSLTRAGKPQILNVAAMMSGDLENNLLLQPGDVLYVPPAAHITVVGDVRQSGGLPLAPGERLLDAVTAAGIPQGAAGAAGAEAPDLSHVTLTREGKVQTVDVGVILKGDLEHNIVLEPADVIYVPSAAKIMVVGAVQRPGAQSLTAGESLLEVLTAAGIPTGASSTTLVSSGGGVRTDAPDLVHVTLTRGGAVQTIDVSAILKGVLQNNVPVQAGDVIYVPTRHEGTLTVLGEIAHPATVRMEPGSRVLDLLNLAGGLNPHADPQHATLQRLGGETVKLDIRALLAGTDTSQNLPLEDGDILTVPVNHLQIAVLGQVAHPGVFDYRPGDDVLQATLLAGGTTPQASLKDVNLVRYAKDNSTEHVQINLEAIIKKGNLTSDQKLSPGDVIYVGTKGQSTSVLGSVLPTLSFLRFLIP